MNLLDKICTKAELKQAVPNNLYRWLTEVPAFTPQMKQLGYAISVNLLQQAEDSLFDDEGKRLAKTHARPTALVRHVVIQGNALPVCYSRVVISDSLLKADPLKIKALGERPIGETLFFNDKATKRDQFSYFTLKDNPRLLASMQITLTTLDLWGRQSVLANKNGEALVTEVYLNALPTL